MKTFASTASRRRALTGHLMRLSILATAVSVGWAIATLRPSFRQSDSDPVPPSMQTGISGDGRNELVSIFSDRLLRELPPVVVASAPAPPPKPVKTPEVELVATVVNAGQIPRAFVRSKIAGKLVNIQEGKVIEGALVKEISDGQLVLEMDGHEFVLKVARKPS